MQLFGLTEADRTALRRTIGNSNAAGKGTAPRPKRRRVVGGGGGGAGGAAGPLARTITAAATDDGAHIGETFVNNSFTLSGVRFYFQSAHQNYHIACPSSSTVLIIGTIKDTWGVSDTPPSPPPDGGDMPLGQLVDPIDFLHQLTGFGPGKVLWASDGSGAGAIEWAGDDFGAEKILWTPDGETLQYAAEEC